MAREFTIFDHDSIILACSHNGMTLPSAQFATLGVSLFNFNCTMSTESGLSFSDPDCGTLCARDSQAGLGCEVLEEVDCRVHAAADSPVRRNSRKRHVDEADILQRVWEMDLPIMVLRLCLELENCPVGVEFLREEGPFGFDDIGAIEFWDNLWRSAQKSCEASRFEQVMPLILRACDERLPRVERRRAVDELVTL